MRESQKWLRLLVAALLAGSLALAGCSGDDGDPGPPGPAGEQGPAGPPGSDAISGNASCLSSGCHGNPELVKTIIVDTATGATETVPLYVNEELYAETTHGSLECVSCHTDINPSGMHAAVNKTYGGWVRFSKSQAVEKIAAGEQLKTRNYYSTAVANSCANCHQDHSGFKDSAHATIFKMRAAHIDSKLTAIATTCEGAPKTIGEEYAVGNCNRCHATCGSCHFKSTITLKGSRPVSDFWDLIQGTDKVPGSELTPPVEGNVAPPDNWSEYQMDWTKNIASHEFRTKEYFATDEEGVCEACHTGYNRPAAYAYYWKGSDHDAATDVCDESASAKWARVKAANVRRHPQQTELTNSGSDIFSLLTGGTNVMHSLMSCADCHGTASADLGANGNIHNLPGEEYDWRTEGDVQCTNCHSSNHSNLLLDLHTTGGWGNNIKVACTGCHTFGLGRDFDLANNPGVTPDSHDVFLDPVTNEVRPVVRKNGHAIAWYSHNWQKPIFGSKSDPAASCAQKCHFPGNVVGAGL